MKKILTALTAALALSCHACWANHKNFPSSGAPHGDLRFESGDRIVFAGDSITALGFGDPDYPGWATILQQNINNQVSNTTVFDSGVPGNTSVNLVQRYNQTVLNVRPSVAVIFIGINDIDFGLPLARTESNLQAMIHANEVSGVRATVLVSPLGRYERRDGQNIHDKEVDQLELYMYRCSLGNPNVYYVPMRGYRNYEEAKINPRGTTGVLMRLDGLHPNGRGHLMINAGFCNSFGLTSYTGGL